MLKAWEKRKLQCTAVKYVTWAFAWKNALSCITRSSVTEVIIEVNAEGLKGLRVFIFCIPLIFSLNFMWHLFCAAL